MQESITGTVYFIGAGPGNPDLLTVKAAKILAYADVIVTDRLVSDDIIQQYSSVNARIISVGKQGYCSGSTCQADINELLVSLAQKYRCVVRLKGGDTSLFSNIYDELRTVNQFGISYEIIPGITAASGASAYTGVPLTARDYANGVKIFSCSSHLKISEKDWLVLAEMENTLVWYMGAKEWLSIARKLIECGADLKTPMLVVEQATTIKQYVHQYYLEDFLNNEAFSEFVSPSIMIVGKVASLYDNFSWYCNQSDRSDYFHSLREVGVKTA